MSSAGNYYDHPQHFSNEEWAARIKLASVYRIFAYLGWDELIYNHISLRISEQDKHFLINPFGLHYTDVCASNLVKIDIQGNIIGGSDWPINPAGFTFHSAIHDNVADGHCVMHVHTTATQAVCCLKDGLSYSNFYAAQLYGRVAWHEFEGITVHLDEGERILASAGDKHVLMLRNHGPVVIGRTLEQAFSLMWTLNRACEIQLAAQSMGPVIDIPEPVLHKCVADAHHYFSLNRGSGEDILAAMTRIIDRIDPSYRH